MDFKHAKLTAVTAVMLSLAAPSACLAQSAADETLEQGREAFLNYRFDEASRLYAAARKKMKKGDEYFMDRYNKYHRQLTSAQNFMERVEKIVVIDSITVPRSEFFKHYRLPRSAGSLEGPEALPRHINYVDYVFTNEGDDYKLWSQPDSTGYSQLVESIRLTDGTWSDPTPLGDELGEGADAIFPFMMADGVTLYYADNGENSIGGYDIMVATRDAADGTFLQPQNLGFPYNSPYDDYLLAIDELNGVGWWATDRNQLDDELTVYVFIPNDLRINYDADDDNLTDYARISDYIATQPEDADYDELLSTIRAIDPNARTRQAEFHFATADGKVYSRYDELPSQNARAAMKRYLGSKTNLEKEEKELGDMRRRYHDGQKQLAPRIRKVETQLEQDRQTLARILNEVYNTLR